MYSYMSELQRDRCADCRCLQNADADRCDSCEYTCTTVSYTQACTSASVCTSMTSVCEYRYEQRVKEPMMVFLRKACEHLRALVCARRFRARKPGKVLRRALISDSSNSMMRGAGRKTQEGAGLAQADAGADSAERSAAECRYLDVAWRPRRALFREYI